jgi:hypothetical protein
MKFLIIFSLTLTLPYILISQSLDNFEDVLKRKKIGKTIIKKIGADISKRTYLGAVNDEKGNTRYFIVKEFLKIKAALVYHGHSRVLFFDSRKKIIAQAILSFPGDLPLKLKNKQLHFKYFQNGASLIYKQDVSIIPKIICINPQSCYDVSFP